MFDCELMAVLKYSGLDVGGLETKAWGTSDEEGGGIELASLFTTGSSTRTSFDGGSESGNES
jgi:hypothetical protein